MPEAYSKHYPMSKTMRHIENPGIIGKVYFISRHIQGHVALFDHIKVSIQPYSGILRDVNVYWDIPRSNNWRCSARKCVLRNFAKFKGRHLCPSLFLNIKKETLTEMFSYEFYEISKDTFFTEHLWATASVYQGSLWRIQSYSDIFKTLRNPCIYNCAIFRTLAYLELKTYSKTCHTCKMIRHIQTPGIVRTVFQGYLLIFRDIDAYSDTFTHYCFYKTFHLKFFWVFWIHLLNTPCSVTCTVTLCCILHQTHLELWHIQSSAYSSFLDS